jgi:hypothetical protein
MASIRRFCLSIVIIFSSTFCVLQSVLFFYNTPTNHLTNILIDFGDNTEPTKDQEHESKLKEDKVSNLNSISLNRLYLSDCSEFDQLDIAHSLEVFLEVVTPPPEA